MTNLDSVAKGLVDQFFIQCQPAVEQARDRWFEAGMLDRVTVSQLRLWAANRALDVLAQPSTAVGSRAAVLREREALLTWLETNGHEALA